MAGEPGDVIDVPALRVRRQIANLHVLEHALAKWGHRALLGNREVSGTHPSQVFATIRSDQRNSNGEARRRQRRNQMVATDDSLRSELPPTAKRFSPMLPIVQSEAGEH
jgi:hypothetical protein